MGTVRGLLDDAANRLGKTVNVYGGSYGTFYNEGSSCQRFGKTYYIGTKSDILDHVNNFSLFDFSGLADINC